MKNSLIQLKAGTRSSNLAVLQSLNSLKKLEGLFNILKFELIQLSSPGDRDKNTDLQLSSPNFFTKDLDDAVLAGELDCAVHSAKDLPYPVKNGLDWFWLPWNEDPRDVILYSKHYDKNNLSPVVGISSERREKYVFERWENAILKNIRGTIEERIEQLDNAHYDVLIMAAAALVRLNITKRIDEYIPLSQLPSPEGQGFIALTFKKDNLIFCELRKFFMKTVILAGAGPGNPEMVTQATINALSNSDICLYDALIPQTLLKYLPETAKGLYVGKREGHHSLLQTQICSMISNYARQGKKVVRLKGGDPGIFGRLAEEIAIFEEYKLPYKVIPGVSSLNAATTATGLLLTRRDISRGFFVGTTRKKGKHEFAHIDSDDIKKFPKVYFMSISQLEPLSQHLIEQGVSKNEYVSVVFNAGKLSQKIISSSLSLIAAKLKKQKTTSPGIVIIGKNADPSYLYNNYGTLSNRNILLTCSEAIINRAANEIITFGGNPLKLPLIKLKTSNGISEIFTTLDTYTHLVLTSPSSVRCFMDILEKTSFDIRKLPAIFVCGSGTKAEFQKYNINPDFTADNDFGSKGFIEKANLIISPNDKILRLRSDLASPQISEHLRKLSANVNDVILYQNISQSYKEKLPNFDTVLFASSSAVNTFLSNWGIESLNDKTAVIIGQPTLDTLKKNNTHCRIIVANNARVESCIKTLAIDSVIQNISSVL